MAGSQQDVMRIFTRGLKVPTLVGKLSGGTRIPGGPYTVSQFVGGGGVLVVGMVVADLVFPWGYFTNRLAVLVAAAVAVFALKFLKVGGRDPLSAGWALVRVLGAPAAGRVAGRAPVLPRPQRVRSSRTRWVIEDLDVAPAVLATASQEGTAAVVDLPVLAQAQGVGEASVEPVRARPARRALTGVELLLAGVGTSPDRAVLVRAGSPREPVAAVSGRES